MGVIYFKILGTDCIRQIQTYKDGLRTERIKNIHRYSNEAKTANQDIYDAFKLKKPVSPWFIQKIFKRCKG